MRSARAWAALFVLAGFTPVAAQEREAPAIFFDGAAFVSFERTGRLRSGTSIISDRDASGTVGGGAFTVGTFVAPRVSLRLETAFAATLDSSSSTTADVTGFPIGVFAPVVTDRTEEEFSQRSVAALAGYHTPRQHRVQLGFLAGVAFRWERRHLVAEQTIPTLPLPSVILLRPLRTELTATTYRPAAIVGFDADITMARRVSLVPQMRVQAVAGLLSLRPGIAVRWIP